MLLELIDDSPLYGEKGTIINNNILKLIPPKHHSLFKERVRDEELYRSTWKAINLDDMQRDLQRIVDNARNGGNPFYGAEVVHMDEDPDNNQDDPDDEDDNIPYWDYDDDIDDDGDLDDDEEENDDIQPF